MHWDRLTDGGAFVVATASSLLLHSAMLFAGSSLAAPNVSSNFHSAVVQTVSFEVKRLVENSSEIASGDTPSSQQVVASNSNTPHAILQKLVATKVALEEGGNSLREHFFTVHEVDVPATPFSDWIVPWDELRKAQVKEFVVRLWILDTGEVFQVDILDVQPASVDESAKKVLGEYLKRTQTNPAIKNDRPVASQRTIEVTLEL